LAKDAYTGSPFKTNRAYAEAFATRWVILSAKYGFILPDSLIPGPYNVTFKDRSTNPVELPRLVKQIKELRLSDVPNIIGLGGKEYRAMIERAFASFPCSLSFPFSGLAIGLAMQATKRAIHRGNPGTQVHLLGWRQQESRPLVSRRRSMTTSYGFKAEEWEKGKEEMRQILIEAAKKCETIAYSDLVPKIKAINLPRNSPAFWDMLGEISTEENADGRGMLTAIVVHGQGDTLPGAGFFKLAKRLGRDFSDKRAFWIEELKRVYRAWCARGEIVLPESVTSSGKGEGKVRPVQSASMNIKYPSSSEFFEILRKGVNLGKSRLEQSHAVEVKLKPGGYQGNWSVIISPDNPKEFKVVGTMKDPTRFAQRIRVAAWALFEEKLFGRFVIVHDRKSGIVTIRRD
jgi:hypothetical protein